MQQFKLYSPPMSEARLHHEVSSAELVDEAVDDGSLVTTIADMVAAIERGGRTMKEMQGEVHEYSHLWMSFVIWWHQTKHMRP